MISCNFVVKYQGNRYDSIASFEYFHIYYVVFIKTYMKWSINSFNLVSTEHGIEEESV